MFSEGIVGACLSLSELWWCNLFHTQMPLPWWDVTKREGLHQNQEDASTRLQNLQNCELSKPSTCQLPQAFHCRNTKLTICDASQICFYLQPLPELHTEVFHSWEFPIHSRCLRLSMTQHWTLVSSSLLFFPFQYLVCSARILTVLVLFLTLKIHE